MLRQSSSYLNTVDGALVRTDSNQSLSRPGGGSLATHRLSSSVSTDGGRSSSVMEQMEDRIRDNVNKKLRNLIAVPASPSRESSPHIVMPTIVHQRTSSGTIFEKSHRRSNSDYQSVAPPPTIKVSQWSTGLKEASTRNSSQSSDRAEQRPIRMSTSLSNLSSSNTDNLVIFTDSSMDRTKVGAKVASIKDLSISENNYVDIPMSSQRYKSDNALNTNQMPPSLSTSDNLPTSGTTPDMSSKIVYGTSNADNTFQPNNVETKRIKPPVPIKPLLLLDKNSAYTTRGSVTDATYSTRGSSSDNTYKTRDSTSDNTYKTRGSSSDSATDSNPVEYSPRRPFSSSLHSNISSSVGMIGGNFPSSGSINSSSNDSKPRMTERAESITLVTPHRIQSPTTQSSWASTNKTNNNSVSGRYKTEPDARPLSEHFTSNYVKKDNSAKIENLRTFEPSNNLRLYGTDTKHFLDSQRFGGSTPCINNTDSNVSLPLSRDRQPGHYVSSTYVNMSSKYPTSSTTRTGIPYHEATNSSISDCNTADSGIERWQGSSNDVLTADDVMSDDLDVVDQLRGEQEEDDYLAMRARALRLINLTSSSLATVTSSSVATRDDMSEGRGSLLNSPDHNSPRTADLPNTVDTVVTAYRRKEEFPSSAGADDSISTYSNNRDTSVNNDSGRSGLVLTTHDAFVNTSTAKYKPAVSDQVQQGTTARSLSQTISSRYHSTQSLNRSTTTSLTHPFTPSLTPSLTPSFTPPTPAVLTQVSYTPRTNDRETLASLGPTTFTSKTDNKPKLSVDYPTQGTLALEELKNGRKSWYQSNMHPTVSHQTLPVVQPISTHVKSLSKSFETRSSLGATDSSSDELGRTRSSQGSSVGKMIDKINTGKLSETSATQTKGVPQFTPGWESGNCKFEGTGYDNTKSVAGSKKVEFIPNKSSVKSSVNNMTDKSNEKLTINHSKELLKTNQVEDVSDSRKHTNTNRTSLNRTVDPHSNTERDWDHTANSDFKAPLSNNTHSKVGGFLESASSNNKVITPTSAQLVHSRGIPNKYTSSEQILTQQYQVESRQSNAGTHPSKSSTIHVEMVKGPMGLGFCIEGGIGSPAGDKPITVKRLFKGETSARGLLEPGDELLFVNDQPFSGYLSHFAAWNYLKALPDGVAHLTVLRQVLED